MAENIERLRAGLERELGYAETRKDADQVKAVKAELAKLDGAPEAAESDAPQAETAATTTKPKAPTKRAPGTTRKAG